MKMWIKAILGISLSFMCLFTCVGYAAINSELSVFGEIEASPPNAVFIMEVYNVQTSKATVNLAPVNIGHPSTKVLSDITFEGNGSYVKFDVRVLNGTEYTQIFDVLKQYTEMGGVEGSLSYSNVKATSSIPQGTQLAPGEQEIFTITLTYNESWWNTDSNKTRKMLYELDFVLDSNDLTQAVSKNITDKFANILNNRFESDIKYSDNDGEHTVAKENVYNELISHMESGGTGAYIGNLNGADHDDKALLTALFEGELTFDIGGEELPVTVLVKQMNVYDSSDAEMVLYITADDLSRSRTYAPVYVAVFTQNSSKEWVQVGDIYSGEAPVCDYTTGSTWGSGSFNTDDWESTQAYYGVAAGSSVTAIMSGFKAQAN